MSIRLVPFEDEHVPGMEATITDPAVLRFTGVPDPTPPGWVATWRQRFVEHDDRESFAIVDDHAAEYAGFVGWAVRFSINHEDSQLELGYATSPWARGRGVATETLRRLTRAALDEGFQRLVLQIDVANVASQRIAEKVGYTFEGTQRSVRGKNGNRIDLQLWSLLPGELV
jgi:RimJ/RimL family protein N-acetyltransferase